MRMKSMMSDEQDGEDDEDKEIDGEEDVQNGGVVTLMVFTFLAALNTEQ